MTPTHRNNHAVVGILAHVDAGKTTLIEALMHKAGAIRTLGRVDHGDSYLDFDAMERQRGITIYSKQAELAWTPNGDAAFGSDGALGDGGETTFTLIDTPGHTDFSTEAERTLAVLDMAVLVVSAADGVQGHTETLWRLLKRAGVPTAIFVNKMDLIERESACSRESLIAELQSRLDTGCVDFTDWSDADTQEACAMTDETALEEFLETGELQLATIQSLVAQRHVFPCFFGAALRQEGVTELLDGLTTFGRPAQPWPSDFAARVYKITHDASGTRLTWLKLTGGKLSTKQMLEGWDSVEQKPWAEKANQLRIYSGEKFTAADTVFAGQVCAIPNLSHTHAGDALGAEPGAPEPALVPVMASRVELNGADAHLVHAALRTLNDEDPALGVEWNEQLQELRVHLMGAIQLEVLRNTMRERFGFNVDFGEASILYRETIKAPALGIGHFEPLRHYAEAQLLLEPLPAGSGVVFGTACHTDELDLNWQRLILTNAMERPHLGVLTGSPITDVRITLMTGRAHLKHTEGGDFRQATYRAIRQGLMMAESVLLEPWYEFSLTVPAEQIGRALSDLQRMSARFGAPETVGASASGAGGGAGGGTGGGAGEFALIAGQVPASEAQNYALEVSAYTHGKGSLSLTFCGYEPCHNADAVIAARAYDPCADLPHTPDSVFCSHGAGYPVKWNEVPQMAHCSFDPATRIAWKEATRDWFGK